MGTKETPKKTGLPQIVKRDMGLKLAEQWVNNMTKAAENELPEVESEGQPYRLGLGAKVSRQAKFGPSNDPLEKKLRAKLNTGKRKAAIIAKEYTPSARDGGDNEDDDDDDDLDSRTSAFDKKRARAPMTVCSQANKKHK
ncbi:uncharacterized protein LOC126696913 [Quercus robur]|uniref:uncharacterized protein LOC115957727 n=1 Tax=Quercus lobata TaxID=97700 RepID=UPI0012474F15|nr:uncharacterized protein LOC115957727 [Quercus lobata]XP_030931900.1 uncharacterized protein LOC115957727 [Quercus lobata]XP_050249626.1 uncharacterized protein LOC126696913 [Quercus robur]